MFICSTITFLIQQAIYNSPFKSYKNNSKVLYRASALPFPSLVSMLVPYFTIVPVVNISSGAFIHSLDRKWEEGVFVHYIALRSFSGKMSVAKGEVIKINDKNIADDLIKAGYVAILDKTKTIYDEKEKYREYK